jgi:hypothetical protein
VAVPLLGRAVNALFDAGQALAKRRSEQEPADLANWQPTEELTASERDLMLHQRVAEASVEMRSTEIEALIQQIEIHQANLARAKKQAAMWGEALVPPIVANTIDTETESLAGAAARLRALLEQLSEAW